MRTASNRSYNDGNMFNSLKARLKIGSKKEKGITWQNDERPGCYNSATPLWLCGKTQSYDNSFPDIVRIAEAFAEVMPYAIDAQGRRLRKQPPFLTALYNPNKEMSASDFLESLITMLLVHPLVHILVWRYENGELKPGGPITPDNVAGFTFLENAAMSTINGQTTFRLRDKTWTRQDVMTLSLNVNPYQLMAGYSPSQAIQKWATVDDYIADYQASQFANGGTPAGLMTITASSVEAYNEAVDRLIAAHTGPQNANRIVYTHRPTSSIDGKPLAAGVEWTPFAQSNRDLTLDTLFTQANKKIDMNFGVPEEVKGFLQNSNYASAEVADYIFARRVLYPKLTKVYSKLTHEANRITGGTGFAFSFDYELPVLTDTRKVQADTLVEMLDKGFTVESAVEALKLPRSFLKLEKSQEDTDRDLQVEETTKDKPSQAEISKMVKEKHKCAHCSGHDTCDKAEENWEGIVNPTIKGLLTNYLFYLSRQVVKKLDANTDLTPTAAVEQVRREFGDDETVQKLQLLVIGAVYYQLKLNENENAQRFARQLNISNPETALTDAELTEFNMSVQSAAAEVSTLISSDQGLENLNTEALSEAIDTITDALTVHGIVAAIPDFADGDNYRDQLSFLLSEFTKNNLDIWADAVADITELGLVSSILRQTIEGGQYRINRWVITEQHRGEELGKLLAAEEAGDVAELEPYKVWRTRPGACASCVALKGIEVRADLPFPNGNMVPADHPLCRCYFDVAFRKAKQVVKVFCPHCKRYMLESSGGSMKNVICANSKCKRHFDIKVCRGVIQATERTENE